MRARGGEPALDALTAAIGESSPTRSDRGLSWLDDVLGDCFDALQEFLDLGSLVPPRTRVQSCLQARAAQESGGAISRAGAPYRAVCFLSPREKVRENNNVRLLCGWACAALMAAMPVHP